MGSSDVEIARSVTPRPIEEVAAQLGICATNLHPYGRLVAKVDLAALSQPRAAATPNAGRSGAQAPKLVLVSAITPTPAGEGKTTTTIGLAQGLARLGESVAIALREPSLGPCLGSKGGATGGGHSQVIPMERINLHFTGDFHAVTAAHNLLAAALDNRIHFDLPPRVDPRRVLWRRVVDLNDRSLREIIIGLGGVNQGVPRETGFDITAASEIMAILCLADGIDDLRRRLERTLVGFSVDGDPVTAGQLDVTGALLALLRDALMPNLVQTLEGVPAFVHGGPFANIAHGCNSVLATRMALHHADWAITEAGFGFDLGAEKFFDIKCVGAGLDTAAVVLVATVRALKMHGGVRRSRLRQPDASAVERGLANLAKHVENIRIFTECPVVALNRFDSDSDAEVAVVEQFCRQQAVPFAVADHYARGGAGALDLARAVMLHCEQRPSQFRPLYRWEDPLPDKIEAVARSMYGAKGVTFSLTAKRALKEIDRLGYAGLPVCMAKTHSSLSDDPRLRGRPTDFSITVRDLQINAGAGFIVVLTGDLLRMPGLPRSPQAERIELVDGKIEGLS